MTAAAQSPVTRVKSWAPVAAALQQWQESSARLSFVGASVCSRVPRGVRRRGQVLYTTDVDDSKVGLAWRWACLREGGVVILDPMAVTTNLALVDDTSGDPLNFNQLMCCLNSVIYSLPWQDHVRDAA